MTRLPIICLALIWAFPALPMPRASGQGLPVGTPPSRTPLPWNAGEIPLLRGSVARESLREGALSLAQEGVLRGDLEEKRALFSEAVDRARAALAQDPNDPESLYVLAVTQGFRIDWVGTWEKVKIGEEIFSMVTRLLELDPGHAGGHHIMGRLHAGVMGIRPFTRFVAHRLLGAKMLGEASWEKAEYHLRQAEILEPQTMIHHLELAVFYLRRDRLQEAETELAHALALQDRYSVDVLYRERAREYREALLMGEPPEKPTSLVSGPVEIKGATAPLSPDPGLSGR